VWHARCYRVEGRDPFPQALVPKLTEDLGDGACEEKEGWDLTENERDELTQEFRTARKGDHLMAPFQCHVCHFVNVTKREPKESEHLDKWALTTLLRANLDVFWASKSSTVLANLREIGHAFRCAKALGIELPIKDYQRGPFPVRDIFGAGMAMTILQRSFDPGLNSATIQWSTCRKLRSFYSNYVHTTPFGTGMATMTDGKKSTHFTASPTNSVWFKKFAQGLSTRLGQVTIQDQAISIDELLALQGILEHAWRQAWQAKDSTLLFEIATIGAVVTNGYAAALRGEELGHARLHFTKTYTERGLIHPRKPHVLLSLQGRFKNVIGRKRHQVPLVPVTKSGIQVQRWLLRLLHCYQELDITTGPLFRSSPTATMPAKVKELDVLFHRYLLMVQESFPALIPASIDVPAIFSVKRSLRRGSTAQARNKSVPKDVIMLNNRWRSDEASKGYSGVPGEIMELYTDVVVAVEALLKYSTPL
jgi:hypothetical protein